MILRVILSGAPKIPPFGAAAQFDSDCILAQNDTGAKAKSDEGGLNDTRCV